MESTGSRRPLHGLRVLALATNIPGPLAAARLLHLGAAVTKIEPPGGDALEAAAPQWYAHIVAGMQVLRLDLKCSQATVVAQLARTDLLLTTMRAGALASAGLAWDDLHARFPQLCHVAILGEAGSNGDRSGHDLTYQAKAGLLSPPAMPRTVFADMFAVERAVSASLEALLLRERTGESSRHDIPIADGAKDLADAVRYGLTASSGPLGGAFAGYRIYRTADGWIALAALEPHFQERLLRALQLPALHAEELQARFAEHPSAYWEALAIREDIPLAEVR
jgi:alpha-methylacyl-CoA racemase